MAGNLYATITTAAILSAGLMGTAYAKDSAKEQPQNFLDSKLDILDASTDASTRKPVTQEQTYKGTFSVPVQLDITNTILTEFPLTYAPHLCIYSADAVKDSSLDGDTAIACQDIAEKTYATAKDLEGVESKEIAFKDLGDVVEGRYALISQGKINGETENKVTMTYFTVEAEAVAANQETEEDKQRKEKTDQLLKEQPLLAFYWLEPWDIHAGRYGANWQLPKSSDQYLEGFRVTDNNGDGKSELSLDIKNFSHNFEFKVYKTEDFAEKANAFAKLNGVEYKNPQEALYAVNARVQDLNDMDADRDLDIWTELGTITELQFSYPKLSRQSYEVKQHARLHGKNGVGRTLDQRSLEDPKPLVFAGVNLTDLLKMNNDPDTFYVIKVAFDDIDPADKPDGKYTDGKDTIIAIDAVGVKNNNEAPNPWAVGIPAYIGGVLTGLGLGSVLGIGGDDVVIDGITPPNPDCPDDGNTGTFRDGDSGTGVERRRK